MEIKAVIFDFAGVLGVDGYWAWLRENIQDLPSHEAYFHDISYKVDRCALSEQEFVSAIAAVAGKPAEVVRSEILARLVIDWETVELVGVLKQRYKTALLSNFIFEWLDPVLRANDLLKFFDVTVISTAHRLIKPYPEIFEKTLSLLGVAPAEAIFIDDRISNVEGGERVGIKSLLFKDAATLQQELVSLGVI